ncbi:hypothetical protein XELAEV_18014662mg [Xenopus laevis]|uniref:Uncharacterized protein n=1 Tax=Xenopus laevis TaxID=8355 RepID=A0A974DH20_XENLA|nr:hypothetical protein XELAEV_18014662mg [Xenopus laevis]
MYSILLMPMSVLMAILKLGNMFFFCGIIFRHLASTRGQVSIGCGLTLMSLFFPLLATMYFIMHSRSSSLVPVAHKICNVVGRYLWCEKNNTCKEPMPRHA